MNYNLNVKQQLYYQFRVVFISARFREKHFKKERFFHNKLTKGDFKIATVHPYPKGLIFCISVWYIDLS